MFRNLQPAGGLGRTGSKLIALGLGWCPWRREDPPQPPQPPQHYGGSHAYHFDLESRQKSLREDEEIVEILAIIMPYL